MGRTMTYADWIHGARPKTLPLAVAPVITGAAVAGVSGTPYTLRFLVLASVEPTNTGTPRIR